MRVVLGVAMVLSLVGSFARAEDPVEEKPSVTSIVDGDVQPPEYIKPESFDFKHQEIRQRYHVQRPIFKIETRRVTVGGVERDEQYIVVKYVYEEHERAVTFKSLRTVTPDGKDVPIESLEKAVKAGRSFVTSTDPSGNISRDVAKLFKDDVILLLTERDFPAFDPFAIHPRADKPVRPNFGKP